MITLGLAPPVLPTLAALSTFSVCVVGVLAISVSVCVHALTMREINQRLCNRRNWVWVRLSLVVLTLLAAHLLEIAVFGLGYQWLIDGPRDLQGEYNGRFDDAIYFSAMVYTTVGFGDITPVGKLRLLVAAEALTGLVLVAWSASFTFFAMSKLGKDDNRPSD